MCLRQSDFPIASKDRSAQNQSALEGDRGFNEFIFWKVLKDEVKSMRRKYPKKEDLY